MLCGNSLPDLDIVVAKSIVLFTPHPDPLPSRGEGKIKDRTFGNQYTQGQQVWMDCFYLALKRPVDFPSTGLDCLIKPLIILLFPGILNLAEDRQFYRLDFAVNFFGRAKFAIHGEQIFCHLNTEEALVFL